MLVSSFDIHHSLFDIHYSEVECITVVAVASSGCLPPRIAVAAGSHRYNGCTHRSERRLALQIAQHLRCLVLELHLPLRCQNAFTIFLGTAHVPKLLGSGCIVDVTIGVPGHESKVMR